MINRKNFIKNVATMGATLFFANKIFAENKYLDINQNNTSETKDQRTKKKIESVKNYGNVRTLNGRSLPYKVKNGVKEFHLIAEPVLQEFAKGMNVQCWGYNGSTPGPTIEVVEGDHVRIYVTNKLPEKTAVHWHGIYLPSGMDGVGGLNQKHIQPGETFLYEFTLRQHGTFMYHPHSDEMTQMAMGMMGLFVVHPRSGENPKIDRDFAFMLHEWYVEPGTSKPNPMIMTDFNIFTFNSRVFPDIEPLVVKTGDRVRIRIGNLSMDSHPIHLHGYNFFTTGTDGGKVPITAQFPETTVNVPVGATRDIEFVANVPGDWAFHCHKSHHTMNAMGHDIPNVIGMKRNSKTEAKVRKLLPGYMEMGHDGMGEMSEMNMGTPKNTLPMMMGEGPFGPLEMGGMFTIVKVRDKVDEKSASSWYENPPGTVASVVENFKY